MIGRRERLIETLMVELGIRRGDLKHWATHIADVLLAGPLTDLSNITINGVRQTWHQLYEREMAKNLTLQAYHTMLNDLSRNEHGRHEGDIDGGMVSRGNPHLQTGQVIGYSLSAVIKYVVPEPHLRGDLNAWRVRNV